MLLQLLGCLIDQGLYQEVKVEFHDNDGDGYSERDGDCDDTSEVLHPGAAELCDGLDNDCNGVVDEDPPGQAWYTDDDGDGYGDDAKVAHACDRPEGDWLSEGGDCDDGNSEIHPGSTEYCDADDVDEDCDGKADNGDEDAVGRRDWYQDEDGDGFGVPGGVATTCDQPAGYADLDTDCDDAEEAVSPGADEVCNDVDDNCDGEVDVDPIDGTAYFADLDLDGYGDPDTYFLSCVAIDGYLLESGDCDDTDAGVNPAAQEVCDAAERDEDCDSFTDDGDASAVGQEVFFPDADGDGHGAGTEYVVACDAPLDFGLGFDDCDDADPLRYPGAVETCDELDSDCDGSVDDADAVDAQTWFADVDADGYGDPLAPLMGCTQPAGAVTNDLDCLDVDGGTWPGAGEACDGVDNDCDGFVDDNVDVVWYDDVDGDGYGEAGSVHGGCPDDPLATTTGGDCDDLDPEVSPAAQEACDDEERDEDCDGRADDGDDDTVGGTTWYTDADGDGHGEPASAAVACRGAVTKGDDCDDSNERVWPGQAEVCNGRDDDCDGVSDRDAVDLRTFYVDGDADGYGAATVDGCEVVPGLAEDDGDCDDGNGAVSPAAEEVVNGIDDDCDGVTDGVGGDDGGGSDSGATGSGGADDGDGDGYAVADGDCNDANAAVNPGMVEVCENGWDDDCDGTGNGCRLEGAYSLEGADYLVEGPEAVQQWTVATGTGWDFDLDGDDDWMAVGMDATSGDTMTWFMADLTAGPEAAISTGPTAATPGGEGIYDYGGDLDADGTPDIIAAFVTSWGPFTYDMISGFSVPVSDFSDSTPQTWVVYTDEIASQFGKYGSSHGDFDGDGQSDIVGAADASSEGGFNAGAAYLWFGPLSGLKATGDADVTVLGNAASALLWSSDACDLDGDGADELILSETGYQISGTAVGGALVFQSPVAAGSSAADADTIYDGRGSPNGLHEARCVADLSGDDLPELGVHSPFANSTATNAGALSVLEPLGAGSFRVEDTSWAVFGGSTSHADFGQHPRVDDFDEDTVPDLGVSAADLGTGARGAVVFYSAGAGTYAATDADVELAELSSSGVTLGSLFYADATADGASDLVYSHQNSGSGDTTGAAYIFSGVRW